jgi:hypothetical protein
MAHTLIEGKTYNDRLFGKGLRGYFHNARFHWLSRALKQHKAYGGSILELGCNDGRILDFIEFTPTQYVGYDADWEGGLAAQFILLKAMSHLALILLKLYSIIQCLWKHWSICLLLY